MRDEGEAEAEADYAATIARQEERRRQGALLVLRECCQRAGAAVDALRRAQREELEQGVVGPARLQLYGARRRLARALRALEEASFDPLVLSAAELAEGEEDGGLDESPFPVQAAPIPRGAAQSSGSQLGWPPGHLMCVPFGVPSGHPPLAEPRPPQPMRLPSAPPGSRSGSQLGAPGGQMPADGGGRPGGDRGADQRQGQRHPREGGRSRGRAVRAAAGRGRDGIGSVMVGGRFLRCGDRSARREPGGSAARRHRPHPRYAPERPGAAGQIAHMPAGGGSAQCGSAPFS